MDREQVGHGARLAHPCLPAFRDRQLRPEGCAPLLSLLHGRYEGR